MELSGPCVVQLIPVAGATKGNFVGARPDSFDTRESVLAALEEAVNSDDFALLILNYFKYK